MVYYMNSRPLKQTISFQLNQSSGVPAYLQIMQQVELALRMGTLRPGDQLPTVKQVVAEVTLNPNTVTKAYRDWSRPARALARSWCADRTDPHQTSRYDLLAASSAGSKEHERPVWTTRRWR
jgi:DNA-binding transcriptional MocR family regulator